MTTLRDIFQKQAPDHRRYCLIFKQANVRPPVLQEMMPDIERLFGSIASRFSDKSCHALQHEELIGAARLKLAELITRGELERQKTRANFFAFLKAAIQNMARSLVQRHRFTEKRTGQKPPPRHQQKALMAAMSAKSAQGGDEDEDDHGSFSDRVKQTEISLDDENIGLQVADTVGFNESISTILEDYEETLSEVERLVFRQLAEPNEIARIHAFIDSYHGKDPKQGVMIRIRPKHLAAGLGMDTGLFEEAVLSVRNKIGALRNMPEQAEIERTRINAALAQLKLVFGLQIPPNTGDMVIKRLLTLAARDQYSKVNAEVAELLRIVGAAVPKLNTGNLLRCYGVLFSPTDRLCSSCGLRETCSVEAANTGLGTVTLSPRLLGARQVRIPVALPTFSTNAPTSVSTDDEEILSYLDENLERVNRRGTVCYTFRETDEFGKRLLFSLPPAKGALVIRVCNPSDDLKTKLEENVAGRNNKVWLIPSGLKVPAVLALIDQHMKEAYDVQPD